jgi:hypothetical protein
MHSFQVLTIKTECRVESLLRPGKGRHNTRTNTKRITQDTVEEKQIADSPFVQIISTAMTQRPEKKVSEYIPWTYNLPMGTMPWYIPQHSMFMRKKKSPMKPARKIVCFV